MGSGRFVKETSSASSDRLVSIKGTSSLTSEVDNSEFDSLGDDLSGEDCACPTKKHKTKEDHTKLSLE